jgi:hypothetical protein
MHHLSLSSSHTDELTNTHTCTHAHTHTHTQTQTDDEEQYQYLKRATEFVRTLAPALNSLKASVYFDMLKFQAYKVGQSVSLPLSLSHSPTLSLCACVLLVELMRR